MGYFRDLGTPKLQSPVLWNYLFQLVLPGLECMDYGRSGVWDSPMATDYWVRRFGFMWGGGNSGMKGIEAFKVKQRIFHQTTR